jgi:hypothetical protein
VLPLARAIPYNGPEPRWEDIPLPAGTPRCIYTIPQLCLLPRLLTVVVMNCTHLLTAWKGRTLRSCKEEYDEIRRVYQGRPIQPHPAGYQTSHQPVHSALSTSGKRTFQESEGQAFFPAALQLPSLQPRPSFSSLSPVVQPANVDLTAPRPSPLGVVQKPKGKPGRPSKEEIARREAEAAAEGRVYVPQVRKRNKPKKPPVLAGSPLPPSAGASASTEASSTSLRTPPRQVVQPEQSSSSGRRKRQRLDEQQSRADNTESNEPVVAEGTTAGGSAPTSVAQSPSDRVRPDAKFAPRSGSAASNNRPGDGSEIVDSEVKLHDPSSRTSHASFEI